MDRASLTDQQRRLLASQNGQHAGSSAAFDRLTRLAAEVVDAPIAAINLLDDRRQRSAAWVGTDLTAPLEHSFCRYVVERDAPLVIEDAAAHPDFSDNPYVTGSLGICFYAGAPIPTTDSSIRATLCVLDTEPRSLDASTRARLEDLAALAADEWRLHHNETTVQNLRDFYEDALNQLPIEVAIIDPEGRYEFVNPEAVSDPEVRKWLVGKTPVDYAHYRDRDPEPFEERMAWIRRVIETGEKDRFKDTLITRSGETKHILRVAVPLFDDDGRLKRLFAYGIDLTDQIEAQRALRESEQRWHRLVERHPEPIMVTIDGEIVYLNQAGADLYGVDDPEDVVGRYIFEFVDAEEQAVLRKRKAQIEEGQPTPPREHQITALDRTERTVVVMSVPIMYGGKRAAQTVIRDITDRKRREAELRRAKETAEEMNRLKTAFLANMSHEIRTPLTSILGFADILGDIVDGEAEELVRLIQKSGDRLRGTLTSVLDLAQLESDSMTIEPTCVDVAATVDDVMAMFTMKAEEKGLTLDRTMPDDPGSVEADERALERVLSNLISNAIKFTDEGRVTVRVQPNSDCVTIAVEDTGVGIDPAFQEHIFDAFKQESTGLTRDFEGVGLGLTITKRLVDLMEGTIRLESEKGVGSTFTVCFPRATSTDACEAD